MSASPQTRRLFTVILALGLWAMAARNAVDPDLWWHLRTGQLILQNHAVFHSDPYSFTRAGQPWINHEWLSDIFIFGLYRVAGWAGLIAGFGAITAAVFSLVFLRCRAHPSIALLITAWAALASAPLWGVRPQTLSLLLISVFLLILDASAHRPRLLWWLPPLMLLWLNLHAGYVAGIALLTIFLLGDGIDAISTTGSQSAPRITQLGLTLAGCLAVIPLNPYGWKMYSYPLATLHSKAMQAHIAEWFSPDFHQPQYWPVLFLMLASVLAVACMPRLLPSRELILLLAAMYMGLRSQRHLAIYAIVAAPIISRLADAWLCEHGRVFLLLRPAKAVTPARPLLNVPIFIALAAFATLRVAYVAKRQPAAESVRFPAAAVAFLSSQHPPGPIFNDYDWGGYLIWKLYPEYRVYIDGRADLYGDSFMDQYSRDFDCRDACGRESLSAWHIQTVLLPPKTPLLTALEASRNWRPIYTDPQAVILTRVTAEHE